MKSTKRIVCCWGHAHESELRAAHCNSGEARRTRVAELRAQGVSFEAIGFELGVSYQRAQQLFAKHVAVQQRGKQT